MPDLYPWVMSKDKYQPISAAHRQWPFGDHDLMATCTDTQYQKMDFLPAKTSLFRSLIERALGDAVLKEEFGKEIKGDPRAPDQRSREVIDHILTITREIGVDLRNYIARDMTLDQIRDLCDDMIDAHGGMLPRYK